MMKDLSAEGLLFCFKTTLVPEFPIQQFLVDFSQGAVRHLAGFGGY